MTPQVLRGQCLCGRVRFELSPPIRDVVVCHCRQCAQWTGFVVAATAVLPQNLRLLSGADELKWYASSPQAERGFCAHCGSSLFWKPVDGSRVCVLAGAIDPPTGLTISAHVFVGAKSDYYDIDAAARFPESGGFGAPTATTVGTSPPRR